MITDFFFRTAQGLEPQQRDAHLICQATNRRKRTADQVAGSSENIHDALQALAIIDDRTWLKGLQLECL